MIKRQHAVLAVVASQAVFARILHMPGEKGGVVGCMAVTATALGQWKSSPGRLVAGTASHRCGVVVHLVPGQAEGGLGMVE